MTQPGISAIEQAYSAYINSAEKEKKIAGLIKEIISARMELFDLKFELAQNGRSSVTEAEVISEFLKDQWPEVVMHALEKTAVLPRDKAQLLVPDLIWLLTNASKPVSIKTAAARTLGTACMPNDEKALSALEQFLTSPETEMRKATVESIGQIGGASMLITALSDKDSDVQKIAVRKLGGLKEKSAVPYLISLYSSTYYSKLKQDILGSLADIGETEKTVPFLLNAINASADWEEIWFAIDTLGKIAVPSDEICEAMLKTIRHPNAEIRLITAKTLGMIKICNAAPALIETYSKETDKRIKDSCISSLQAISRHLIEKTEWQKALEILDELAGIKANDPAIRKDAALCQFKNGDYAPALEKTRQVLDSVERGSALWLETEMLYIEILTAQKKFKDALEEIDKCLKANSLPEDFKKKLVNHKEKIESETAGDKPPSYIKQTNAR